MTILDTSPSSALRARISSAVVEPGDPDWAAATEAFNLAFVQKPALVAIPADESDVIEIVNFARERGMQVAPQRTGHNAEPLGAMDDVILVRTDRLRGVEIDAARPIARVRAGAKWRDVLPLASEFGLAALHGSTGDVSVAGYSLGGGVGWYARKHGLSANSVVAIELVTPDGRFRRVDADNDPDLFWGLRGGGGNFGIVTALEIRLYPIASVYAGMMFFAFERAHEVLHAWRGWTTTAPEDVTSVGRLLQFPPIPDLPPEFSGRRFVAVDAVVIGDQARGEQLLAPLRALGPEIDTFALVPPADIGELHMDPPSPVPYAADGQMLGDLDAEAIDRFLAAVGPGSGSELLVAEIRHVGGALRRPEPHHGALGTFDASYLTLGVGMVLDEESGRTNHERLRLMVDAFAPYDTGRQYLNFAERRTDPARFYTPDAYRRLRVLKAMIDPDDVMRANHRIPPAW
jgi:FAD/FMN-containing dehydrogenase